MNHNRLSRRRIRMPKVDAFTMYEYVAVGTDHTSGLQADVCGEHSERVVQSGDPFFVNFAETVRDKVESHSRMGIGDHPTGLQGL